MVTNEVVNDLVYKQGEDGFDDFQWTLMVFDNDKA